MSLAGLQPSVLEDPSLAGEGERVLAWTRANMPLLGRLRYEFESEQPLAGLVAREALTTLSTVKDSI